ncbi:hypothetical protein EJB05_21347, partial [Eragrostis curvula]
MAEPGKEAAAATPPPPQPQGIEAATDVNAVTPVPAPTTVAPPEEAQFLQDEKVLDAAVADQSPVTPAAEDAGQQGTMTTPEDEHALPPASPSPPPPPPPEMEPAAVAEEEPLEPNAGPPAVEPEATPTADAPAATPPQTDPVTSQEATAKEQSSSDAAACQPQQTMQAAGEPDAPPPTTAAEQMATPPPDRTPSSQEKAAPAPSAEAGEQLPAPQQPEQTGGAAAGEVASSAHKEKEKETAAEAGEQLPAPTPPQQAGGVAAGEAASSAHKEEEKDQNVKDSKAQRLWGRLRAAVRLLFHRPTKGAAAAPPGGDQPTTEDKGSETTKEEEEKKPSAKKPRRKDSSGGGPAVPAKEKDEGEPQEAPPPAGKQHPPERRKSLRRTKSQVSGEDAAGPDGKAAQQCPPVKKLKLQKAGKLVVRIMSWYNRHRSQRMDDKSGAAAAAAAEAEADQGDDKDGGKTKPKTEPAAAEGEEGKESSEPEKKKPGDDGKQDEMKEKKPHPKWAEEEKRLENILEEAFTKLLATEYTHQLKPIKRKCLLTFSIFNLAVEVKKQNMVYWWVSEFHLPHRPSEQPNSGKNSVPDSPKLPLKFRCRRRKPTTTPPAAAAAAAAAGTESSPTSPAPTKTEAKGVDADAKRLDAEGIMSKLSDLGFLQPIKNYCCGGIHGCKVNPLVHWMVKRLARDDRFAELDADGNPTKDQSTSGILCLTVGCRDRLHKMRVDELQAGTPSSKKGSDEAEESTKGGNKSSRTPKTPSTKGPEEAETQGENKSSRTPRTPSSTKGSEEGEESTKGENKSSRTPKTPSTKGSEEAEDSTQNMGIKSTHVVNNQQVMETPSLPKQVNAVESTKDQKITHVTNDSEDAEFKEKRVILNVDAHVYPLSKCLFKHLSDCLVMLQLGRWCHHDNKTYMEVNGLESEPLLSKLKNLRYLSLRGLSRLSKLPCGIKMLKSLEILDMRGCQNLVTVASKDISQLKHLTHLDLTECYMLEHIGREITSLPNLQVFKGFVFGSGAQGNKRCRVRDLKKLKKLQKLSINITTDANIGKGDMEELKHLVKLRSLTITWSEIPSILEDASEKIKDKREQLLETWTTFELPQDLDKLDLRCYPKISLDLKKPSIIKKLYLRGGEIKNISIPKPNRITTLRLRYLKKLDMTWDKIISISDVINHVEIRVKDERLLNLVDLDEDDKKNLKKEIDEEPNLLEKIFKKEIDEESILDEDGVWIKDDKEEKKQPTPKGSSSGPSEVPSNNDATAIPNADKPGKHDNDGDDINKA